MKLYVHRLGEVPKSVPLWVETFNVWASYPGYSIGAPEAVAFDNEHDERLTLPVTERTLPALFWLAENAWEITRRA